ncbi:MAG: TIGR04552 family protein, partial [Clostridia bacterium]|nr:TIGR04552 family protein [Deltaproteobacteria bacterium]
MLSASSPSRRSLPNDVSVDDATVRKLFDLNAVRLALTGESVVDSGRPWFRSRDAVDEFLRLSGFDTDNPLDMARVQEIHEDALAYLTDIHQYRLPIEIEEPAEIHDLFLLASCGPRRLRKAACMTLKVMHIMQHIAGRELASNVAISESELLDRLNAKVFGLIDRMRASKLGVREFAAGKKTRTSLVTKLLAKRDTLATHIFDRLRYRVILESRANIVQALQLMVHELFPFNYVVPEQSQNGIITPSDLA